MHVEACCQNILKETLPDIDPNREGVCLDIGVGNFAFYCDLFSKLKFSSIAVEPFPNAKLRRICKHRSIQLLECCLSNQNGTQTLYLGQFARLVNNNFNSLESEWFASSKKQKIVSTITLLELLKITLTNKVTCLKLDIEGWEMTVIQQLKNVFPSQIPQVLMFEYGGGCYRYDGKKSWSPKFLNRTMKCLETLQQCGYRFTIVIDYAANAIPKTFDLKYQTLDADQIFMNNAIYGNIITFYNQYYSESKITQMTAPYHGTWLNWLVEKLIIR